MPQNKYFSEVELTEESELMSVMVVPGLAGWDGLVRAKAFLGLYWAPCELRPEGLPMGGCSLSVLRLNTHFS